MRQTEETEETNNKKAVLVRRTQREAKAVYPSD